MQEYVKLVDSAIPDWCAPEKNPTEHENKS